LGQKFTEVAKSTPCEDVVKGIFGGLYDKKAVGSYMGGR
jgi:hypothetical protein